MVKKKGSARKKLTPKLIIKIIEKNRHEISQYSVKKLGLFGSYLKGTQRQSSDLDFLVKLKKPTFDNYMDLKFYLERLFKKKVDLITEESVKPALRYIKKEAVYAKRL